MTDTIYLIITPNKVDRMVKTERSALDLYKNEIAVKLNIHVDAENWTRPFIEKEISVERYDKGIELQDIHFNDEFVTEEEAQLIRQSRLDKMRAILESEGYTINKPGEDEDQ